MHTLESFLPHADLALDSCPLLQLDLSQHVVLNHNHFVQLVDLSVDNFVLDGFNCPHFNVVFVDLSQL